MKKIALSLFIMGAISATAFSQTSGQTGTSTTQTQETTTKTQKVKTQSTNKGTTTRRSPAKKHYGWTKGKHVGSPIKHTKTTTTTTNNQ